MSVQRYRKQIVQTNLTSHNSILFLRQRKPRMSLFSSQFEIQQHNRRIYYCLTYFWIIIESFHIVVSIGHLTRCSQKMYRWAPRCAFARSVKMSSFELPLQKPNNIYTSTINSHSIFNFKCYFAKRIVTVFATNVYKYIHTMSYWADKSKFAVLNITRQICCFLCIHGIFFSNRFYRSSL